MQSLFFMLVLVENLALASVPLFLHRGRNRAAVCLGEPLLRDYVLRILGLCIGSWVFHSLYYKYMGHPWSDINGPGRVLNNIFFLFLYGNSD